MSRQNRFLYGERLCAESRLSAGQRRGSARL